MLCDKCRHCENPLPCDYDNESDTCRYNKEAVTAQEKGSGKGTASNANDVEKFCKFVVDYCKQGEATAQHLQNTSFDQIIGHGCDVGGMWGALAYFDKQTIMYGYEIPNIIKIALDEWNHKQH